ncbi:SH3 domain-containing protein [Saccharibacillus sp. CPCC 101409]|uniref:SH3 domain-containing protein n=1 Tax=Saccharibacillus sp. CPCC 101409 TaxID=3058041 RepID=UPI0026715CB1|nr:SH3 domain-containing protein [Saccharibacillus sp. CPCC 101409]MDO3410347.1 SH3 domain-containing protein [Saccharibacillus sp. CPCC 101409]
MTVYAPILETLEAMRPVLDRHETWRPLLLSLDKLPSGEELEREERPPEEFWKRLREFLDTAAAFADSVENGASLQRSLEQLHTFNEQGAPDLYRSKERLGRKRFDIQTQRMQFDLLSPARIGSLPELIDGLQSVKLLSGAGIVELAQTLEEALALHRDHLARFEEEEERLSSEARPPVLSFAFVRRLFASRERLHSLEARQQLLLRLRERCLELAAKAERLLADFKARLAPLLRNLEAEIEQLDFRLFTGESRLLDHYRADTAEIEQELLTALRYLEQACGSVSPFMRLLGELDARIDSPDCSEQEAQYGIRAAIGRCLSGMERIGHDGLLEQGRSAQRDLGMPASMPEAPRRYSFDAGRLAGEAAKIRPYVPGMAPLNLLYLRPVVLGALAACVLALSIGSGLRAALNAKSYPEREAASSKAAAGKEDASAQLGTARIATDELHVRSEPRLDAPSLGTVTRGTVLPVLERRDGWLRIGRDKWISGSDKYVEYTPGS